MVSYAVFISGTNLAIRHLQYFLHIVMDELIFDHAYNVKDKYTPLIINIIFSTLPLPKACDIGQAHEFGFSKVLLNLVH